MDRSKIRSKLKKLWTKNKAYKGLDVGLRNLNMKYDRIQFDSVVESLEDVQANPFISFYDEMIEQEFKGTSIKIVGIAVTFQDQIISAFTLANLIRKKMPEVKIVFGGQMVTRCYTSMISHPGICRFFDYLALWEGEKIFVDIHRKEINREEVTLVNVVDVRNKEQEIVRKEGAPLRVRLELEQRVHHRHPVLDRFLPARVRWDILR